MWWRAGSAVLAIALACPAAGQGVSPITIVAAENFYGDLARQLAGPDASVTSILSNPDQDPHLFEASPSVARAVAGARIVISNGAEYDPWMAKLLRATAARDRQSIVVADLARKKPGDNPHLWYDTAIMALAAKAVSASLTRADPGHDARYADRLAVFTKSLEALDLSIAALKARFAGVAATATEPVAGYMVAAIGLTMRNERFQLAVMNETEPRVSDVAAFERDLREHRVRVLIHNSQASNNAANRLLGIAREAGIPVVDMTETAPVGTSYQAWMGAQLAALAAALSRP